MERDFNRRYKLKVGDIIVVLFSVLPIIDSINGFMVRSGALSVGSIYKAGLVVILLASLYRKSIKVTQKHFIIFWIIIGYIFFSVFVNIFVFQEDNFVAAYMIKLLFNIMLFLLLMENYRVHTLKGIDFYNMLNRSTWTLIVCYLIPYVLGVGETVYAGEMGYKAFFYAQNELSLIIIVMFYFCVYKLYLKIRWRTFLQTGLVFLCAMLLNTKATILACCIGMVIWLGHVFMKQSYRTKLNITFVIAIGIALLHRTISNSMMRMISRFAALRSKYYEDSIITSILSARDNLAEEAWNALLNEHTFFRFLFGNGFCSDVLVEMDIIDIFFYLGIIGAVAVATLFLYLMYKSYLDIKLDDSIIKMVSLLMIFGVSTLAGHVLFMATSGCFFILYICFLLTFHKKDFYEM